MARLSQGWALNPADRAEFAEKSAQLKRLTAQHGRDPDSLEFDGGQAAVRSGDGKLDLDVVRAGEEKAASSGATIVSFLLRDFCRSKEEIGTFLDFVASLEA